MARVIAWALGATGLPSIAMLLWAVLAPLVSFGGGYALGRWDGSSAAELAKAHADLAALRGTVNEFIADEINAAVEGAQIESENDAVPIEPVIERMPDSGSMFPDGLLRELRRLR